jgi:hypothetical protein
VTHAALAAYEAERRPATTDLVMLNRRNGPEQVMQLVEERAPDGYDVVTDVLSLQELEDIAANYKRVAGFQVEGLNAKPPIVTLPAPGRLSARGDLHLAPLAGRDAMGQATKVWHHRCCQDNRWSAPMQKDDLSRSLVAFDQNSTLVAVVELSLLRREMARLAFIKEQIKEIEKARLAALKQAPREGTHPMLLMLARVMGIGVETADMLVHEVLSRKLRDQRAVARYGGITGAPDESGSKRREKGLARAGNARVRRGMIQLAWRWLMFQKASALTQWFEARTEGAKSGVRKTMIVALARKLLIALWRFVTTGEVPAGAVLRPAA